MNKVTMVARMEILHELRNIDFHQDWPGYDHDHCWAPNLSAEKTNTEPPTWHHSLEWSASYLEAGWLHWATSIMKGQHFVLTGIDIHYGHRFASFAHNASVKTTICGYIERLIYHHGITHNIASNQGTHLTAKKCGRGPMLIEFTSLIMFPTILKQLAWLNSGMAL